MITEFARFVTAARVLAELSENNEYQDSIVRIRAEHDNPRMTIDLVPTHLRVAYVSPNGTRTATCDDWHYAYEYVVYIAQTMLGRTNDI